MFGKLKKLFKPKNETHEEQVVPQDHVSNQEMIEQMGLGGQVQQPLGFLEGLGLNQDVNPFLDGLDGGYLGNVEREQQLPEKTRDYDGLGQQRTQWLDGQTKGKNRNLQPTRMLGSGLLGKVYEVQRKDGQTRAFKGEGNVGDDGISSGIDPDHGMNASREVATWLVAQKLGSNVIGKVDFGEGNGVFGSLSEIAPGEQVLDYQKIDDDGPYNRQQLDMAFTEGLLRHHSDEEGVHHYDGIYQGCNVDFSEPTLQRDLVELQINDFITGQVDRHIDNFHVDEGNRVHAFDHDMSFGKDFSQGGPYKNTVGLPPVMSKEQAKRIEKLNGKVLEQQLLELLPEREVQGAIERLMELKGRVIDLWQEGNIRDGYDGTSYTKLLEAGPDRSYVGRHVDTVNGLEERLRAFREKYPV